MFLTKRYRRVRHVTVRNLSAGTHVNTWSNSYMKDRHGHASRARSEQKEHLEAGGELERDEDLDDGAEETDEEANDDGQDAADELEHDGNEGGEDDAVIPFSIASPGVCKGVYALEELQDNEDAGLVRADAVAVVAGRDDELNTNINNDSVL